MPYKTGSMKGELTTPEIRKLIKAHNILTNIKIPKGAKRDEIIKIVNDKGYTINHDKQSLDPMGGIRKGRPKVTMKKAQEVTKPKPKTALETQKAAESKAEKAEMKKKQERVIRKKAVEEEKARTKPTPKSKTASIAVGTETPKPKNDKEKSAVKKTEPKKEEKQMIDKTKLKIFENPEEDGFFDVSYNHNNVKIMGEISTKKSPYFYLISFTSQENKNKARAKKGLANYYLCGVLKELIKMKKYGLKLTSDFRLEAGNLEGNIKHNQGKLENYYKSLGFNKGKQVDDPEAGQPFKQSISSFLKNCEKFKENPLEQIKVNDLIQMKYGKFDKFIGVVDKITKEGILTTTKLKQDEDGDWIIDKLKPIKLESKKKEIKIIGRAILQGNTIVDFDFI